MRIAVVVLGSLVLGASGCHSSTHGVGGSGSGGGNAHGDASGDAVGDGTGGTTGGGGGTTSSDGGADARGGGGGATTGAGGGSGAIDAGSDIVGANCNTLLPGPAVSTVCAPDGGAPPTPSGGTLVPGTYILTSVTDYGYCDPISIAQTIVLTANTVETAAVTTNSSLDRVNSTFTTSGSSLFATETCPGADAGAQNAAAYSVNTTAGITTLTLLTGGGTIATVLVYTKQ